MKNKIDSINFKSYTISNIANQSNLIFDDFIGILLGVKKIPNQENFIINQESLLYIVYNIPISKMPGYENSASLIEILLNFREHFSIKNNQNKVCVCNYIIQHFLQAIQSQPYLNIPEIRQDGIQLSVIGFFNQLDLLDSKHIHKAANAMAADIRLINIHAFLNVEFPVNKTNTMTTICNNLMKFIKYDLLSSITNPEVSQKKLHLYVDIATQLLEKKPISDFHGAGSIYMALYLLQERIQKENISVSKQKYRLWMKLNTLFSMTNNYKNLRDVMDVYSVPALWIYSKDFYFTAENTSAFCGMKLKGKQYYSLMQTKRNICKSMPLRHSFRTNLIPLLEMMRPEKIQSSHGFFSSNPHVVLETKAQNQIFHEKLHDF